jgi:pyruvate/2-oxoglutarate dehydrogenase complex dihydrolipoamide acyltransferase (E2) component
MICKLDMPLIDPSLRGGRVVRWSKNVGDSISFGDEICIVALDEFAALRRTARATLLAGRKRKKLKSDLEVRSGKVFLEVALTSSDQGVLRRIIKEQGDQIVIGDTLAIVTSEVEEDLGQELAWAEAPVLRVVANPVGDEENLEGRI